MDYALLSIDKKEGSNKPHLSSKIINVSKQVRKEIVNIYNYVIIWIKIKIKLFDIIDCIWNYLQYWIGNMWWYYKWSWQKGNLPNKLIDR